MNTTLTDILYTLGAYPKPHQIQLWEILYLLFLTISVGRIAAACAMTISPKTGLYKLLVLPALVGLATTFLPPLLFVQFFLFWTMYYSTASIGVSAVVIIFSIASFIILMNPIVKNTIHEDFGRSRALDHF
jgi:hypothetical protein